MSYQGQYSDDDQTTYITRRPKRVIERDVSTNYVDRRNHAATVIAASKLIWTLVTSAVVITLLVIGIMILVRYGII